MLAAFERGAQPDTLSLVDDVDSSDRPAPSWTLRGGTPQILKGIIARGLGLR